MRYTELNHTLTHNHVYLYTELRCYDAFGYEFFSSSMCARVIYALPLALDAVAVVGARRGQVRSR